MLNCIDKKKKKISDLKNYLLISDILLETSNNSSCVEGY